MKYAVIILAGKQYKVTEGTEFSVNRLETEEGKTVNPDQILLVVDEKKTTVGTPEVAEAKVVMTVVKHECAPKIRVATYKAKSRQRKVRGHKQLMTTVKVLSIK